MALIAINVAVYLIELGDGGATGRIFDHGALFANGLYQQGQLYLVRAHTDVPGATMVGVAHGEWWRLITAAFLHLSIIHVGLNMVGLYFGGRLLEPIIGRWRFALLYLAAALAGSAGALYATPNGATAGASGAIFGVFGALLVLERRGNIATGGQVLVLIVINLIFSFSVSGISVGGHIGGLIGGIVVMLGYTQFRRSIPLSIATAVAVCIASVVFAFAVV